MTRRRLQNDGLVDARSFTVEPAPGLRKSETVHTDPFITAPENSSGYYVSFNYGMVTNRKRACSIDHISTVYRSSSQTGACKCFRGRENKIIPNAPRSHARERHELWKESNQVVVLQ